MVLVISYNFFHSSTRIRVECVFGKLKGRFKVLHGATDRHAHTNNARMICAAAVLHNLHVDIGDDMEFEWSRDDQARKRAIQAMSAFDRNWDRTKNEVNLGAAKRNAYMDRFYRQDNK